MKYIVHVERVVRLRRYTEYTFGPYRFRWTAKIIAWLHTDDRGDIWESAEIREVS